MKKVAFIFDKINTIGLYESIAEQYKKNNWEVIFVDISFIIKEIPNEFVQKEINDKQFRLYTPERIEYKNESKLFNKNANRILNHINPNIIFVPYEFSIYFYIVNLAKLTGVRTIHIQHGLWGKGKFKKNYNVNLDYFKNNEVKKVNLMVKIKLKLSYYWKRITNRSLKKKYRIIHEKYNKYISRKQYFPLTSDYVVVPSNYYSDQIKNEVPEFNSKNILNPGYLRGDNLYKDNSDIYLKFNLPRNKKIISYFYSPFHLFPNRFKEKYSSLKALEEFCTTCNQILGSQKIHILILIHPTCLHYVPSVKKYLIKRFNNFSVKHSMNSQGTIYKNSILIGGVKSGALTEASLFNSNIIRQDYVLEKNPEDFQIKHRLVYPVNSKDSMEKIIVNIFSLNHKIEKKHNPFIKIPDGNCGIRLFKLLEGNKIDSN